MKPWIGRGYNFILKKTGTQGFRIWKIGCNWVGDEVGKKEQVGITMRIALTFLISVSLQTDNMPSIALGRCNMHQGYRGRME